ncbi:hypothetical protein QE152_g40385 [Popillia japonica]|uniref:Uncharacterized protein n=1 Tax=Popillia japonica TaxID=7064 RepID=A0AAW1HRJ6_POPJA
MNETRGKTRKKCVSVAYNHAPYKVDIQGNDVKCGRCNVMDMLSCDDNTLGVLTAKRKILLWRCNVMDMLSCDDNTLGVLTAKRKILLWEDMLRFVEAHIGTDHRINENLYRQKGSAVRRFISVSLIYGSVAVFVLINSC